MTTRLSSGVTGSWIWVCSAAFLISLPATAGVLELAPRARSSNSAAQTPRKDYAVIYGTVWGPDDHPVAGVPISIRRVSGKKAKWELVSDRNGEFAQRVPVGTQDYIVQADIKTPKGKPKPEVTVHIDDNERKDIGIHLSR